MTRVFIWKNNSPQEWEEISFSAFSKARRNGCFTGRFFVETVKMFRDEDDRIIMECSRKDFEKYQQEDRHSRYLQEHEKSRSIFPASHVGDRDGTEEGYQDTDLFVDESVDTAEQAIQNLLLEDLHQALLKLSPAERDFILSYYEMKIPNATCLAQRYGITRQAADKRLEMKMALLTKTHGQNLKSMKQIIQLIATELHHIPLDMQMETNGPYQSVTDVLHPDGSGEPKRTLRRQLHSLLTCILIR